jgi:Prolipoprotein diacylglyceryl transferase
MAAEELLARALEKLLRPRVSLAGHACSAFKACGNTGYFLSVALGMVLAIWQGLSPWIMAGIVGTTTLTFLLVAMAAKIVTGEEQLVYYHHEIAVIAAAIVFLRLVNAPILPYLDATILGLGLFLACGRIGCLMVGCCHGRPSRWGVAYRAEHATEGFPQYLIGVRLFPIQAVESLGAFMIVGAGTIILLTGGRPGEAFAWYVVSYGAGRFVFEFARGDAVRPYAHGLSEAQWTSVLMVASVAVAEGAGLLTFRSWHLGVAALLVGASVAIALVGRLRRISRYQLLDRRHIRELACAVRRASTEIGKGGNDRQSTSMANDISVARTSQGIQISAGRTRGSRGLTDHYSFSQQDGVMTRDTARMLANLVVQLERLSSPHMLISGEQGVFHLLVVREIVSPLTSSNPRAESVPVN